MGKLSPRIPREHNKYHGYTVRGTPHCPLIHAALIIGFHKALKMSKWKPKSNSFLSAWKRLDISNTAGSDTLSKSTKTENINMYIYIYIYWCIIYILTLSNILKQLFDPISRCGAGTYFLIDPDGFPCAAAMPAVKAKDSGARRTMAPPRKSYPVVLGKIWKIAGYSNMSIFW